MRNITQCSQEFAHIFCYYYIKIYYCRAIYIYPVILILHCTICFLFLRKHYLKYIYIYNKEINSKKILNFLAKIWYFKLRTLCTRLMFLDIVRLYFAIKWS